MKNYRYIERRNRMIRRVGMWVLDVVLALILAWLVFHFVIQASRIRGESMEPTYYDNDIVLVNKMDYRIHRPKRYDAALIRMDSGSAVQYTVKRVVGLPGEEITIRDGVLYIDKKPEKEHFTEEIISAGLAAYSIELGEGEYFVMGDNYNNSEDSRVANIGNISQDQFVGRVMGTVMEGDR